jgi:hypothetical protein
MRFLPLLAILSLVGCGGGGSSPSTDPIQVPASNVTMQAGQWEFVATPATGGPPVYIEANLAGSNAAIGSTVFNTGLFQFGGAIGGQF